ncbi:putative anti-sigma-YlaC factor YlaD [Micromonospora pisi]|uniref:Putative anti-sigma-YlaC factor YlaD n=1 Tax=Micromonospora pisi TaxID=589240 RepID=A0A495JRQ3_9ACTN|nr:putative anti-sigma-YlaC factor YlaD [Micromonospora pisi]
MSVGCEQYREALSAWLDGEDDPAERHVVERHLGECAECRSWMDAAATVTRLARTSVVSAQGELDERLLAAAPGPGRLRLAITLRVLLGVLGAVQFVLGAAQIAGIAGTQHLHDLTGTTVPANHLWHESAAWNVAIGAGFGWIALRRTRPVGILPTLTAFVAVLTLLSANDMIVGRVDVSRILSHGFIVAGYLIILALTRPALDPGEPPRQHDSGPSRWRASFDAEEAAPMPPLRLVRSHPGPRPAHARHDTHRAA